MLRRALIAFAFLLLPVCAVAQVQEFLIERIEVRNAQRVAPRVIVAETLLQVNGVYSEEEVRAAVTRLARSPFVTSADYTLEPGSSQPYKVVVITVTEAQPFSALIDARFIQQSETGRLVELDYDFADPTTEWKDAAAGIRWHPGGHGYAHAGMTVLRSRQNYSKNYAAWEIGYTQHNLLGTRIFATVNVRTPVDSVDEGTFTPSVIVGMPLSATQTLSAEVEDTMFVKGTFHIGGTEFRQLHEERRRSLSWTYDTTDGPFARTRGTFARVTPFRWMRDDADFRQIPRSSSYEATATHLNTNGVDAVVLHYWPLGEDRSVFAGVTAGWARVGGDTPGRNPSYEVLEGGYSRRLFARDARLELEARLAIYQPDLGASSRFNEHNQTVEIAASWAWKSKWGPVRIGAAYGRGF